jgi:hypothetical protein
LASNEAYLCTSKQRAGCSNAAVGEFLRRHQKRGGSDAVPPRNRVASRDGRSRNQPPGASCTFSWASPPLSIWGCNKKFLVRQRIENYFQQ